MLLHPGALNADLDTTDLFAGAGGSDLNDRLHAAIEQASGNPYPARLSVALLAFAGAASA